MSNDKAWKGQEDYDALMAELAREQTEQLEALKDEPFPGTGLTWGEVEARQELLRRNPSKPPTETAVYEVDVHPRGLVVHAPEVCQGRPEPCVFHNPSSHHMLFWTINIRLDRLGALAERICPHGVGHPDPDSLAYVESLHAPEDRGYEGIHGCDGCCVPPNELVAVS